MGRLFSNDESNNIDLTEEGEEAIHLLFEKLLLIFPAYERAWPDQKMFDDAKDLWIRAFKLSKINTTEQLQYGIGKCIASESDFVPSIGKFISWCKPSAKDLGFPNVAEAFIISRAMNAQFSQYVHKESHVDAVIRHAIEAITPFTYRQMSQEEALRAFETYYNIAVSQYMEGNLKPIPKAVTNASENTVQDRRAGELIFVDKMLMDYYKYASEAGKRKEFLALVTDEQRLRINEIINFLNYGTPVKIYTIPILLSLEQKQSIRKLYERA
jgi:hypothetical protein